MTEVTIRAHTRRGKGGKTVKVRGYSRRVGRKGIHSPKREKTEKPGEELEKVTAEKNQSELAPEKIVERREIMEEMRRMKAEREALDKQADEYYKRKRSEQRSTPSNKATHAATVKNPLSPKGSLGILERVEDKIAKFVEKYSGKKYKRQL